MRLFAIIGQKRGRFLQEVCESLTFARSQPAWAAIQVLNKKSYNKQAPKQQIPDKEDLLWPSVALL